MYKFHSSPGAQSPLDSEWTVSDAEMETRKRWVEALRSGSYRRQRGKLRNNKGDRRCCLGVACTVRVLGVQLPIFRSKNEFGEVKLTGYLREDDSGQFFLLPKEAREALGFKRNGPRVRWHDGDQARVVKLEWLNDDRQLSFKEIADLVEQTYIEPFKLVEVDR